MTARHAQIVAAALLGLVLLAILHGYASGAAYQLLSGGAIEDTSPRTVLDALLAPGEVSPRVQIAALGGVAVIGALVFAVGRAAFIAHCPALHGDAKLGGIREARAAGLLDDDGPVLGKLRGRYVRLPRSLSAMLFAAPEQMKTASVVIPTCALHPGPMFVTDIKPDLFEQTSAYRKRHGQRVYRFAPFDPEGRTHCYNPFSDLPENRADRIDRIMFIGAIWHPLVGIPIWPESCRQLFLGLALYLDESPGATLSFAELYRHGSGLGLSLRDYTRAILKQRGPVVDPKHKHVASVLNGPVLSETCRFGLNAIATVSSEQMASSIDKTFLAAFAMFANPRLAAATSHSDFLMQGFAPKKGRAPQTVYFAMGGDDISRAAPLVSLMFTQLLYTFTRQPAGQDLKPHERCVALLDEGGQLGYIDAIRRTPAVARDHGFSMYFIAQSPGQISDAPPRGYGHDGARTLVESMPTRLYYTPASYAEADELSKSVGTTTTHSTSRRRGGLGRQHPPGERSESEAGRAVMLPQEAQRLSPKKALLRTSLGDVILIDRVPWFRDAEIVRRLCSVSPSLAAFCRITKRGRVRRWPTKAAVYAARSELSAPVPLLVMPDEIVVVRAAEPIDTAAIDECNTDETISDADVLLAAENIVESIPDAPPLGDDATEEEMDAMAAAFLAALDEPTGE